MFSHSGLVCEQVKGKRRRGSNLKRHRKECPAINGSNNGLFTCGGCHTKFRTICCLHVHIDKHQEGGSYTYDHVTKTAFPKYDSICAFTQVEDKIFELISGSFPGTEKSCKSIQTSEEQTETNDAEDGSIRKSKRIAKRKCDKALITSNEETESDGIAEGKKKKLCKTVDSIVPKLLSSATKNVTDCVKKKKRRTNAKLENINTRKKSQGYPEQSKKIVVDETEHKKDEEQESVSYLPEEKELSGPEKDLTYSRVENVESINPKTDEIAASEALLAISKSADGERKRDNNKQMSDGLNVVKPDANKDINDDSKSKDYKEDIVDTDVSSSDMTRNVQEESYVKFLDEHKIEESDDDEAILEKHKVRNSKPERFRCPTCGKYGSKTMITYHRYLHKDQKEHSCDVCGKLFQHPSCLKVHLRCHSGRQYQCGKCDAMFSRKKYLETHMLKHTGEKPYMCETCGKGYRDASHLKRHIKHVHDKKRDFECDVCQERFFRSDHLKCHRMRHFGPGHRCQFCKKIFKVKLDLERHLKSHTDEKKWFCHLCGHGFRYPVPYYSHMLKKHEIERAEAEIWRKKQIDNKRKALYIDQTDPSTLFEPVNSNKDINEAPTSDQMIATHVELSSRPSVIPTVRKIFLRDGHIYKSSGGASMADNLKSKQKGSTFEFNNCSKEVRVISDGRGAVNSKGESNMYLSASNKGYQIVSMGDRSDSETVHVLSNLTPDTTSLQQGLTFAMQNTFTDEEIDGARVDGIVGYGEEDQIQGDQLVVMAEETVVDDIHMMSEIAGESNQAVIYLSNGECDGKDMTDKGTML